MSTTDTGTDANASDRWVGATECARWRRAAGHGISCRVVAAGAEYARSTVTRHAAGREGCDHDGPDHPDPETWDAGQPDVDRLTAAGMVECVRDALDDALAANFGDTVYCTGADLRRRADIDDATNRVSAALGELAESDGELHVERTNSGANHARWMVRRAGGDS